MLKNILKNIVADKKRQGAPDFVIKNFLKEYLQYPVLQFIYNSQDYKNFIFTGGSCLRICFEAPRLSEDLDFDLTAQDFKKLNLQQLSQELKKIFEQKFLLEVETKCQGKNRVYLKFPILKDLGLAKDGESDLLYVKIETEVTIFKNPKIGLTPISYYGYNFVARNYGLDFLMTGKLNAIFTRKWFKGKDDEINVKGRDFYDLFWYWQNNVEPDYVNLKRLVKISNQQQLKAALLEKIKNLTTQKLSYDLKNFFPDQEFIMDFCKNYKKFFKKFLD